MAEVQQRSWTCSHQPIPPQVLVTSSLSWIPRRDGAFLLFSLPSLSAVALLWVVTFPWLDANTSPVSLHLAPYDSGTFSQTLTIRLWLSSFKKPVAPSRHSEGTSVSAVAHEAWHDLYPAHPDLISQHHLLISNSPILGCSTLTSAFVPASPVTLRSTGQLEFSQRTLLLDYRPPASTSSSPAPWSHYHYPLHHS